MAEKERMITVSATLVDEVIAFNKVLAAKVKEQESAIKVLERSVGVESGLPRKLPLPMDTAAILSYAVDILGLYADVKNWKVVGSHIAYVGPGYMSPAALALSVLDKVNAVHPVLNTQNGAS